jgi:hypothetical protein
MGGYPLRVSDLGYELQVLLHGVPVQTFTHTGESFVMGQKGARYTLRVVNHTERPIEAVVSVDGRDVLDGKPADFRSKRGYLVPAWGGADIDGWRLSQAEVAAFRFASVADSYAARTGSARDVGVIGVAVFPERPQFTSVPRARLGVAEPRNGHQSPDEDSSSATDGFEAQVSPGAASPSLSKSSPSPARGRGAGAGSAAAPSAPAASALAEGQSVAPPARRRPGLATEFGEAVRSAIHEVSFTRANPTSPSVLLGARYNDREGLVALGIDVDGSSVAPDDLAWRQTATPFPGNSPRFARPPTGWLR